MMRAIGERVRAIYERYRSYLGATQERHMSDIGVVYDRNERYEYGGRDDIDER